MKKISTLLIALLLIILIPTLVSAEDQFYTIGKLFWGEVRSSSDQPEGNYEISQQGILFAYDLVMEITENWEMGFGVGFEGSFYGSFSDDIELSTFPIYVLGSFYPFSTEEIFYLTARLGLGIARYADNRDKYYYSDDRRLFGIYYALGAGCRFLTYPRIKLEALISANHYSVSYSGNNYSESLNYDAKIFYPKLGVTLGIGY